MTIPFADLAQFDPDYPECGTLGCKICNHYKWQLFGLWEHILALSDRG